MQKFNFTKQSIEELVSPTDRQRAFYGDTKIAGLQLMVTGNGIKSFKVTRKYHGRLIRVTLGRFPDMTVELARKKASETLLKIADGVNPNDEKREIRHEITFGELVNEFVTKHCKQHNKHWEYTQDTLERLASSLYSRKASSITNRDLLTLHVKVGEASGRYQANRLIEKIRAVYNKAIEWGWPGQNPVRGITKYEERSRDRFLHPDEMPRFMAALASEPNGTARDFILMALMTGARRENVLAMRWEQINFHNCTWRIPETKNGEPQIVVLVPQAIQLLSARMANSDTIPWIFPGKGKKGHFSDPKKTWKRVLKRAGIDNLRIHDLRRTLGSWQAAMGANSYIIGKSLGHKSAEATAIYARLNLDPVRESVARATEAMFNVTNPCTPRIGTSTT